MMKDNGVSFELAKIFGHQHEVKGCLGFYERDALFYLSGQFGVRHDLRKKSQKMIPIREDNQITAVSFGQNGSVITASKGNPPTVSILNLKTEEKISLPGPKGMKSQEYVFVSPSVDDERVGAQGGAPDWVFVLWCWKKRRLETIFHPSRMEKEAEVYTFAFCPDDSRSVAAVGRSFLRFYQYKDGLKVNERVLYKQERSQEEFHSVAWIKDSCQTAIGTSTGEILVFKNKILVRKVSISNELSRIQRYGDLENRSVTCMSSTVNGIICSHGNTSVLVFEDDFEIRKVLNIPNPSEHSRITQLAVSQQESHIAASTEDGRILYYSLEDYCEDNNYQDNFLVLQDYQHTKQVNCADTVNALPLQVTCSSSNLIVRDLVDGTVLLRNTLDSIPISVSLHPLGINVLVGFENGVKFYNILSDSLEEVECFRDIDMSQVSFAPSGHLMAITKRKHINLFYSIGFKELTTLTGHHKEVQIILWRNDSYLLSSDDDGTLHEWDISRKKSSWNISMSGLNHTSLAIPSKNSSQTLLYVASSDCKIRLIQDGDLSEDSISTKTRVTAMTVAENTLIAGTEKGSILGVFLSLRGSIFEIRCHVGVILHLASFSGGSSVVAVGSDNMLSIWNTKSMTERGTDFTRQEVLIDIEEQDDYVQSIAELEKNLRLQIRRADEGRARQSAAYKSEVFEATVKCKNIETSLRITVDSLKEEIQKSRTELDDKFSNIKSVLQQERDENEDDFKNKVSKEKEQMQRAIEERAVLEESLKRRITETAEKNKCSIDAFKNRYARHEETLLELEEAKNQEIKIRQAIYDEREDFYRKLRDKEKNDPEKREIETETIKKVKEERLSRESEMDKLKTQFQYEKECSRSFEEEIKRKQNSYELLQDLVTQIKSRLTQSKMDVSRVENVLNKKSDIIKNLEGEVIELTAEGDQNLQEYEKTLHFKREELQKAQTELQKLKDTKKKLSAQLKSRQREEMTLTEKLMSTENSMKENTNQLLTAERILDRYRSEFVSVTSDCTPKELRWALLKLYEKRVVKTHVKEETVFVGDSDPYLRFCRQRDHYEDLIDTVRGRTSQIQGAFRKNYVRLAKENSDWTASSETTRVEIRRKLDRIRCLEEALGMKSDEFSLDPAETQRRFNDVAESIHQIESKADEEIKKKTALVEEQKKEVKRLHGLLSVGEIGKIVRKRTR